MHEREDGGDEVRGRLLAALEAHAPCDAREAEDLGIITALVRQERTPFDRALTAGHLTASAVVVAADGERVLLVHHRALDRWLQPGGHGEPGEDDPARIALREAREETGVAGLCPHPAHPGLLDVDVHRIPAKGRVAAHDHLDLRFLVAAPADATLAPCPEETRAVRWFAWDELDALPLDPATRRMFAKARRVAAPGGDPARR